MSWNRCGSGEAGARPTKARAQRALVSCQLALSMLLLVVGGALLASLDRQQKRGSGIRRRGARRRHLRGSLRDDRDLERNRVFTQLAAERLSALPGVTSVSVGSMAPLNSDGMRSTIHIPGYTEQPDEDMEIAMVTGGPDFFRTLGIPTASRPGAHLGRSRQLAARGRESLDGSPVLGQRATRSAASSGSAVRAVRPPKSSAWSPGRAIPFARRSTAAYVRGAAYRRRRRDASSIRTRGDASRHAARDPGINVTQRRSVDAGSAQGDAKRFCGRRSPSLAR